ncbi:MAG: hypothetical protein IJ966_03800 [Bacilli bacterium]|nr:hypothetical protein [Bacilli bacterium]
MEKVYVNKIDKINNNEVVYYSYKDNNSDVIMDEVNIQEKINELFRSREFIYKKKLYIRTKYGEGTYFIISRTYDYLLTIDGEKIYIKNIVEIR